MILTNASPHLQLWLLLCSDLAIRSGTSSRLNGDHYDQSKGELRFSTKYDEKLTLPVTDEIAAILATLDTESQIPFVTQLRMRQPYMKGGRLDPKKDQAFNLRVEFQQLRSRLGIKRKLTAHDLRRTTAVALYQQTKSLRSVQALLGHRSMQSTLWYLDHDMEPVHRPTLELIKGNRTNKGEKTA